MPAKPKRLFARQASIAFTAGAGGETIYADGVRVFVDEVGADLVEWTRRASDYHSRRGGRIGGHVQIILDGDDSNPETSTFPIGVVGVLTILKNKTVSAHGKIAGPFIFEPRRRTAPAYRRDGRQELVYNGYWTEDLTKTPTRVTETA